MSNIGKIIHVPTAEEKAEAEKIAKIRKFEAINRTTIYGPLTVEQLLVKGLEDAKKAASWKKDKETKAEIKKIKAELRKEASTEARKMKAILADIKREQEKAEKKQKIADMIDANAVAALGVTPVEAVDLIKDLEHYMLLIATVADEVNVLFDKRDELRAQARAKKTELEVIAAGLKKPMASSKYRAVMKEKLALEVQIENIRHEIGALRNKGVAYTAEKNALRTHIHALKKNGNSAVRPTIRAIESVLKRNQNAKQMNEEVRLLQTITERVRKNRFQIPSWDSATVLESSGLKPIFEDLVAYRTGMKNGIEADIAYDRSKAAVDKLSTMIEKNKPIRLHIKNSRPSAIQENMLSMCMKIDTESKSMQTEWINVEHKFHDQLKVSWRLFSNDKKEGTKQAQNFVESVFELLDNIEVQMWDESVCTYKGLYSSASHQKHEKLVCCREDLMNIHERLVWFGRTKQFVLNTKLTGAQIWKMRANMARPIAFAIVLKDGTPVYLHNIYMVPDVEKTYHHKDALFIGGNHNGVMYERRAGDNNVIMGDGASLSFEEFFNGKDFIDKKPDEELQPVNAFQGGGNGVKLMDVYSSDAKDYAEEKHDMKANLPEGKFMVCGFGCFKFDKLYDSYDEFAAVMDEMATKYPGINRVYALRQSEELEDDEKIRRVSRSLLQQLIVGSDEELYKLAKQTIDNLNYKTTFEGLFASMAELGIPAEKRSDFAKLIFECPALLTNINVQMIGKHSWELQQSDAIGNKLRTKGQYPYIMQDPVALIEVWLLHIDPNDPNLGVLKDGEVSAVGVKDGKEMVIIRYPANFFTAKTVVNRVMKDIFGRCGNVAIISIHDDVLIIQDGDVDGDEAGLFYDKTLVMLVNRMRNVVKPPVVVFEHGDKAKPGVIGTEKELRHRMYSALWSAKEFDSVGKYANLARDCAYLASIALRNGIRANKEGDLALASEWDEKYRTYILWMAAASTGAILAIDQVKGNAIDPNLIDWLKKIEDAVKKLLVKKVEVERDGKIFMEDRYHAPFTQPFVKGDMTIEHLDPNPDVGTDNLGSSIYEATGTWRLFMQEFNMNKQLLAEAVLDHRHALTSVRTGVVTEGILTELRPNYFNRKIRNADGSVVSPDGKVLALIANKQPVGQKDLLLMYYRNMCTLEFRMQEKNTVGRRKEYYAMVRRSLFAHALSTMWIVDKDIPGSAYEFGHVFTDEEKLTNVVNNAVKDALELGSRGNNIANDDKGKYAKFVLSVFAPDIIENIRRNNVDIRKFMDADRHDAPIEVVSEYENTDFNQLLDQENEIDCDSSVIDDSFWVSDEEECAPTQEDYEALARWADYDLEAC